MSLILHTQENCPVIDCSLPGEWEARVLVDNGGSLITPRWCRNCVLSLEGFLSDGVFVGIVRINDGKVEW